MRRLFVVLLVLAASLRVARAEPPEAAPDVPLGWSMAAGLVTAMVPMAVGADMLALSGDSRIKHAGIDVMAIGLGLAPLVSHLVAHEWKRGLVCGAISLAAGAVAVGLLEGSMPDDLLDSGTVAPRISFGAALAVELFASGAGLVDSLMARERARSRRQIAVAPLVGRNLFGLALGGTL